MISNLIKFRHVQRCNMLVMAPKKCFIDSVKVTKEFREQMASEEELKNLVSQTDNSYNNAKPMKIDQEGKNCIYDNTAASLRAKPKLLRVGMYFASLQLFYNTWFAVPFVAMNCNASGALFGLLTLYNIV